MIENADLSVTARRGESQRPVRKSVYQAPPRGGQRDGSMFGRRGMCGPSFPLLIRLPRLRCICPAFPSLILLPRLRCMLLRRMAATVVGCGLEVSLSTR